MKQFLLVLPLAIAVALPCHGEKFHNSPGGGDGGITASVSPIKRLERAVVIEPVEYKAYLANIDRGAGKISISGLPPGKYDLLLKFDSVVIEGIHLDVPGGFEKLSKNSVKGITHRTFVSEPFFNKKYIARMGGNNDRVKMVIEHIRDKRTFQPDGTVLAGIMIRRIELCEMRRTNKIWQVKESKHLFREERKMGGAGTKLKFVFCPELGGVRVGDNTVELPKIVVSRLKKGSRRYFYSARWQEK